MSSFNFDKDKLPEVSISSEWQSADGGMVTNYNAGEWYMTEECDTPEEEIKYAEEAVYAWIAWLEFLKAKYKR